LEFLTLFLIQPIFWVILGISFIILEVFSGEMYFLPNGISALIVSSIIFLNDQFFNIGFILNWAFLLILYAFLAIILIFIFRYIFHNRIEKKKDLNLY